MPASEGLRDLAVGASLAMGQRDRRFPCLSVSCDARRAETTSMVLDQEGQKDTAERTGDPCDGQIQREARSRMSIRRHAAVEHLDDREVLGFGDPRLLELLCEK